MKKSICLILYTIILILVVYRVIMIHQEIWVEGNTAYVCIFDHVDTYDIEVNP